MTDLLNSMTAREYFGRIMSLPLAESKRKYNYEKDPSDHETRPALETMRKLSRYREYINRRENLLLQIRQSRDFSRTKGGVVDLYINLGVASLRAKECEQIRDGITDPIVKQVVIFRYFTDTKRKIPSWSETARTVGVAFNGKELQSYVNRYFSTKKSEK